MRLQLTDVLLMESVKSDVETLSLFVCGKNLDRVNTKSSIVLKNCLLLDLSHNCFVEIQQEFLKQFPMCWWMKFHDNNVSDGGVSFSL